MEVYQMAGKAYVLNVYNAQMAAPPRHVNTNSWAVANPVLTGTDTYFTFGIAEFRAGGYAIQDAHKNLDHCYYVLSGKGVSIVEGKRFDLVPNDALWVPGNFKHEMFPAGNETFRVIVTLTGRDFNQTNEAFVRNIKDATPVKPPPNHTDTTAFPMLNPKVGAGNSVEFHITEILPTGAALPDIHEDADHVFFCLSGRAIATCDDQKFDFGMYDALYVPMGVKHSFEVVGEEVLRLAVTFAPSRKIMRP
jgi:mannose-6-phosphate isomerase-like protein (cupin superfamily)